MFERQGGVCACGCGVALGAEEGVIAEHTMPVAMGNEEKPDALWRKTCASEKTARDLTQIAKAKRQAGETGQQARRARGATKQIPARVNPWPPKGTRKIPSRPFPKRPRS